jgi:hypothetical protein
LLQAGRSKSIHVPSMWFSIFILTGDKTKIWVWSMCLLSHIHSKSLDTRHSCAKHVVFHLHSNRRQDDAGSKNVFVFPRSFNN